MLKTEAIQSFLHDSPFYMANLYKPEMEVQVNVARDDGEAITGVYAGLRWQGYTDGIQTWKHFRIPWNASVDPQYIDREIKFDISKHTEAIGMTGWDWLNKKSKWVGFDFDSIINHEKGLTQDELQRIQRRLEGLEFISLFSSTSGTGLHVYIFLNINETINNHTEHAAIARAILSKISTQTGLELEAKVDTLGGNMWVWHRKAMPDRGLKLLKEGNTLTEIPPNWRSYLNIVSKKTRVLNTRQAIEDVIANRNKTKLDDEHLKLFKYLDNTSSLYWYDDVRQMLVCHTADLKRAHQTLNCKGFFDTISTGKDHGQDQNCFCFPQTNGAWIIRRHTRGVVEHPTWFTDNSGWTTCYFNKLPNFRQASGLMGGIETEKGYTFNLLSDCYRATLAMGVDIPLPENFKGRKAGVEELRDNRARVFFKGNEEDVVEGWTYSAKKKQWEYYFFLPKVVDETDLPDHIVRHVITQEVEFGWFINTNNGWTMENKSNLINTLVSLGYKRPEVESLLGRCVLYNWKLVNKPFKPEYPGDREWNKTAAKLKYNPERGQHRTWDLILEHCGKTLNPVLLQNEWALDNGIINGLLYLQAWIASIIQHPEHPTPYLFLYGPQNTGKSILHESLALLFTSGYCRADRSLTDQNGFNGELAGSVLCVVEETNLSKKSQASDRIKDWVTGLTISIRALFKSPYLLNNTTHWIQCANSPEYCPVFPGDTRITMIYVGKIESEIPKNEIINRCIAEAPAFLYTLLNFELPEKIGRLAVPVIETGDKLSLMKSNDSLLIQFISEEVHQIDGIAVPFSEFCLRFNKWLSPKERLEWTDRKVGKQLPFVKGKYGHENQIHIGNISFDSDRRPGPPFREEKGKLKND